MLNAGIRVLPREGQLYIARGVLYAQLGDFEKATSDFEAPAAVKLDPSLAVAREVLADLYLSDGKTARAAARCETVLQSDSDHQEALYRLILMLRKSDRKQEMPTLVKRLLALREAQKDKAIASDEVRIDRKCGPFCCSKHSGNAIE